MLQQTDKHLLTRGRLFLVAAALLWSTSGLIVKSPPLERLTPLAERGPTIACYRAAAAAICLLPFVRFRRIRFRPMLIPLVISFALMNVLFITAMTYTTAAAAIFLQYTSTLWAFLVGVFFLKEPVDRKNVMALGFGLMGIIWIVAADWSGGRLLGTILALASGLGFGGVVICLRVLREEDGPWMVTLCHAAASIVLLPWVLSRGMVIDGPQWGLMILLGVMQMGIPYVLFCRGVRDVPIQEAALIPLLEPICNPVWVWIFWGEKVPVATLTGGALIVLGLFLRYAGDWLTRTPPPSR